MGKAATTWPSPIAMTDFLPPASLLSGDHRRSQWAKWPALLIEMLPMIKMYKKAYCFFRFFSIFRVQHTRVQQKLTTILTTRRPGPLNSIFLLTNFYVKPG